MYKPETLAKYARLVNEAVTYWEENYVNASTCVSYGNRKIGRAMNVSLLAGKTCGNCSGCLPYCYDIKACIRFVKNVLWNRAKNTVLALYHPEKYFSDIRKKIARKRTNKYFRWHVSGDIPNYEYFLEMVAIAREFPDWKFWTYTKMYHIVNRFCDEYGKAAIPENLSIMFSPWEGMEMINPQKFPEFITVMENEPEPEGLFKCPGNCDVCKALNRGCIRGETTYNNLH